MRLSEEIPWLTPHAADPFLILQILYVSQRQTETNILHGVNGPPTLRVPPGVIKQQQVGSQNHYLKASAVTRSSRKDKVAGRFGQSGTSVSHFLFQAILWNIFRIHFEILFEALRLQN